MKIARYWAREEQDFPYGNRQGRAGCWGWSSESKELAREDSRSATQRFIEWIKNDEAPLGRAGQYGYPDRPPREEILKEFADSTGEVSALLTRNSYGSVVLNTRSLAFADVDLPAEDKPAGDAMAAIAGLLGGLFGTKKRAVPQAPDPCDAVLDRIRQWAAERPAYALRVYRTAAGFRCVVTNRELVPGSDEAQQFLDGLGSDLLYRRLCDTQECFRARLSPKPWRIACPQPPNRFPWPDAEREATYRQWQRDYERRAEGYATCRLVDVLGPEEIHDRLAPLVHLHDQLSACDTDKPLA